MGKPSKAKVPWSETPEGREHAQFAEREKLGRPMVDENLCFICQEKPPTHLAERGKDQFKLCSECAELVELENARSNRIKQGLARGRGGDIFRMVLGADLLPIKIQVKPLEGK